ncbi:hypothetical protein [Ammoniphilus sp. 3BR4]|uniref:hypothetical protein n=1 Tax=Ammoniphilus sp. 3BR4 TaxID=3158265 RepID=UPI00346659F6
MGKVKKGNMALASKHRKGVASLPILNPEERYEAFVQLLQSRLDRDLSDDEQTRIRRLAGNEDFQILQNLIVELGGQRTGG